MDCKVVELATYNMLLNVAALATDNVFFNVALPLIIVVSEVKVLPCITTTFDLKLVTPLTSNVLSVVRSVTFNVSSIMEAPLTFNVDWSTVEPLILILSLNEMSPENVPLSSIVPGIFTLSAVVPITT